MKCEYCASPLEYEISECPRCGAPCEFVSRPTEAERIMDYQEAVEAEKVRSAKANNKELRQMSDIDISFLDKNREKDKQVSTVSGIVLAVIVIIAIAGLVSCFSE